MGCDAVLMTVVGGARAGVRHRRGASCGALPAHQPCVPRFCEDCSCKQRPLYYDTRVASEGSTHGSFCPCWCDSATEPLDKLPSTHAQPVKR